MHNYNAKGQNLKDNRVSKWNLLWKVPCIAVGIACGIGLLLLIAATIVVVTPSARMAVLEKAVKVANDKTEWDIDLGRIYLSPFHHSPKVLYRAYRGKDDLPLHIEIDSLFVGHRGQDTLICIQTLRLRGTVLTSCQQSTVSVQSLTQIPIIVDELHLDRTTFHSDSMIDAVGIDAIIGNLDVTSPELVISKGQYPLHGLHLADAYIGIDLRDTPDTTELDTTPLLMAFDVPDGELSNVRFVLTPLGMDIKTGYLATNVLADVGANKYDVRSLHAGGTLFALGNLNLPMDTLYGDACVDLERNLITSNGLHARSDEMGAKADLSAIIMDLESMRVDVVGDADYCGSKASLRGYYDIDDEVYDMQMNVERVNLSPFLKDSTCVILAGEIKAKGKGIDIGSRTMQSEVQIRLTDAIYDNINVSGLSLDAEMANMTVKGTLHLPVEMQNSDLQMAALTEYQFCVSDFMTLEKMAVDWHAQMSNIHAYVAEEHFDIDKLKLDFSTDSTTSIELMTNGLSLVASSPMHLLQLVDKVQPLLNAIGDSTIIQPITSLTDLTMLDTLRCLIPDIKADMVLKKGSPVQHIIEQTGLDINQIDLSLTSDAWLTTLDIEASIPEISHPEDSAALRLPAARASVSVDMTSGKTNALLVMDTKLTDGAMSLHNLSSDVEICLELERTDRLLSGSGQLFMGELSYGDMKLGNRSANLLIAPSERYANAFMADIRLDDIPLDLVDSIIHSADLDLEGSVRTRVVADGLPSKTDISAEIFPLDVTVEYKPYSVELSLGETPIVMEHNYLDLNKLPVYGVDNTYITLTGGLDIESMRMDIVLSGDNFVPVHLVKDGPIPVYGDLATDIQGRVTGAMDSIMADIDVTIMPTTDLTYPIDNKNLAQVKPHGTVNIKYSVADEQLNFGGRINVDDGIVRYSPKMYPIMPFHVDSGSYVDFQGSIGQTMLNMSASQHVKANVQSKGEDMRRVDFTTGVRVNGVLDSMGLDIIGFFLEAPGDEVVSEELASLDEDTREGIAAALLATGMYMGASNVAVNNNGYSLTSIINSRIDAAMANSKKGKVIDIDISSSQNERAEGIRSDFGVELSKSFFKDKFRLSVGASITDNPEASNAVGLYGMASAEYKLTKKGNVLLRAFTQRDYNNILEGDLQKSGIGIRVTNEWKRNQLYRKDTIMRTYDLVADADIAYRSNNSIGPNLTIRSSIRNLMGHGETFTIKGYDAYYWALRNRQPGDPKKTDTYKLGIDAALVFPYLHWLGDNNPEGDTRYRLGYHYENIAGGYGVHKISGSFTYFIQSTHSNYITHAFTPFSLSMVHLKVESEDFMKKAVENPQLIKLLTSDEFVPSVEYEFTYNDYQAKRVVNTMFDLEIKEAGNLMNAIYSLFGSKWNDKNKQFGHIPFNQFVKLNAELHNKFNLTDKVCIATRFYAGFIIPLGNSIEAPISESFYAGGPNGFRASVTSAYGPGNFYSFKFNQSFFHTGDIKLEANVELRFPLVWKLYGSVFLDAGNIWNWRNTSDIFNQSDYEVVVKWLDLHDDLYDGFIGNPYLARQIALGTGAGLRLDIDGLVIRFDLGIGIHAPYQTFKYTKDRVVDFSQPIKTYYNIPSVLDGLRLNFSIGYPF